MHPGFTLFLIRLHIVSLLATIALWMGNKNISEKFQFNYFYFIVVAFYVLSIVLHIVLHKANAESPKKFIRMLMATSFLKLFGALITVAIAGFLYRKAAIGFILNLMVSYLIFLAFDVITLSKTINKK